MKKYEYDVDYGDEDFLTERDKLDKRGENGWRLVAVCGDADGLRRLYFEREVIE